MTAASDVVRLPDEIDDVSAAALPIVYGTAYGALCWAGRLRSGETLMVHGAARRGRARRGRMRPRCWAPG